ncbi:MAG: dihydropteroate synthase [Acidobacteriaceae bacterium]
MPFESRPHFDWKLRTRTLALGAETLVMGILNVTPDSFSDGGKFLNSEKAIRQALHMLHEGAAILDIGGESTRPGNKAPLTAQQEQDRVLPVIEGVLRERPDAVISVDTYRAATAQATVQAGAEIVNDVSGLLWDKNMAATCAALECGVVLMHTRGKPDEWRSLPELTPGEVVPLVQKELEASAKMALDAGIARERMVLDPGFGFGKAFEENYPLLARLGELKSLGYALLAGTSRKSFLGRTLATVNSGLDAPVEARLHATLASTTAAILAGAHIVRVHDVRPAVEAAAIADEVLKYR